MVASEFVKLPPRFPVTWTPQGRLRLGHDDAHCTLDGTEAVTSFISDMRAGLRRSDLVPRAMEAGLSRSEARRVSALLASVMSPLPHSDASRRSPRIAVLTQSNGQVLGSLLRAAGNAVKLSRPSRATNADLIVFIETYLGDPRLPGHWLAQGTPHCLVRYSDQTIQVGPIFVESGPCHGCLSQHEKDRDPGWAYRASQLIGRRSPMEEPPMTALTNALVVSYVERWKHGDVDAHHEQSVITRNAKGSTISHRTVLRHPACGCSLDRHVNTKVLNSSAA